MHTFQQFLDSPHHFPTAVLAVSAEFLRILTQDLSASQLELAAIKNKSSGSVDHLHDYCDANQLMLDAIGYVFTLPSGFDLVANPATSKLIDAAWQVARHTLNDVYMIYANN